jgi:cyclase
VRVPVIASGGAGGPADIARALQTGASAALAASIFHDGVHPIDEVKREVAACGLPVRI